MTDTTRRWTAVLWAAAVLLAVAAIAVYVTRTRGDQPAGPAAVTSPSTAASQAAPKADDPYEVYLKLAPDGAPNLSREDAQARALLGCGQAWAPGTVDAALAEAYADLCKKS